MSVEKRIGQQIRMVERLLAEYKQMSGIPLARFLTGFHKRNRQMGSRDRREISRLVYRYFRIGHAASQSELPMRLAIADFLCDSESVVAPLLLPSVYPVKHATFEEKVALLEEHTPFRLAEVFPFYERLSMGIDTAAYTKSMFVQPDLFIRLYRMHAKAVVSVLASEGIEYELLDRCTAVLPNGTALERVDGISGKYEVQDYSSQQTGAYFNAEPGESWWDACAGAGGKSLLLLDNHPGVNLLVSDVRNSILRNLDGRFQRAGIKTYRRKIIDLTKDTTAILGSERFDGIILDAPCSGSGTWSRTPEMISSFDTGAIRRFADQQKQIAENVINHLKPGKPLVYVTCSAFAAENEQVVAYLQQGGKLKLECAEVLHGYRRRADTMYVARLIKM
ncbi:RsmB/NOP family class I SAM-dependent RNA methyltransferase [Parapedobacter deserti]|uniref:RsmB/NOP family class I SAM-dependent RNA methyltransferase n=1 Tax=Parapedobacter deserti TaxID=1912957 RepID=A0ABV7JFX7_9SPHI